MKLLDHWKRPARPQAVPAPAPARGPLPDLTRLADPFLTPAKAVDEVRTARELLAWLGARPGCRAAWFLCRAGEGWAARDRFADADPLPEGAEESLALLAESLEGARASRVPLETLQRAHAGLPAQCRRRGIDSLLLQPLPAWAPWPAALALGLDGADDWELPGLAAAAARDLAFLLWLCQARRELGAEQARVEEEHSRLMVQGFELDRVRQLAEREVELARRRVDEAERAKNEFLSSVSHELRTPLNAIQGYTRMVLREPNITERQRLSLERVMTSSQNQLRLINNILDYSRLEAGRMRLELEELDLTQVLRDVALQVEPLATEQGLGLQLEVPAEGGRRTVSDRAKLEQVLINLVGNAIKFTQKGTIVLRLRLLGGAAHVDVQDSGIGIPQDEQEQIFERFRRSRQSEGARSASGTGLGLAISRRLAELLGGGITVASEPGQGSTFTLSLPLFMDLETARLALFGAEAEES